MKQIVINQFEKIVSDDYNQMQLAIQQSMHDNFIYRFFGTPSSGVFGSDLTVSFVSALAASISVGSGFFYDSSQTGNTPKFRMITASAAIPVTLTAAHATLNRIDRVCLAPNFAVTASASRYIKTGGTGPIVLSSVSKTQEMTYTLNVVAGTPNASPVAPSTPAGHISLATCYVHAVTGMASGSDITDTRNVLGLSISNSGHYFLTGATIQTQLDNTDVALLTNALVVIASGATLSMATHAGRLLQLDSSSAAFNLTLPALSLNTGMKAILSDYKGFLDTNPVTLIPNGTDKIMGLNSNYELGAAWGQWDLYSDATGWYLK